MSSLNDNQKLTHCCSFRHSSLKAVNTLIKPQQLNSGGSCGRGWCVD